MSESNLDRLFDAISGLTRREKNESSPSDPFTGETFLVVGLGNPGRDYRETRHNIGFMLVDRLAERMGESFSRAQFKALVTQANYQGHKVILAKPQAYMNLSGHPTRSLISFYKLEPHHVLIAYDDVDLPFDTIRMKPGGGSGGHKGMNSIIEQLGTKNFPRLRLGVGHDFGHKQAANYVLKPFSKEESEFLEAYLDRAADAAFAFIREGIDQAMTIYNRSD